PENGVAPSTRSTGVNGWMDVRTQVVFACLEVGICRVSRGEGILHGALSRSRGAARPARFRDRLARHNLCRFLEAVLGPRIGDRTHTEERYNGRKFERSILDGCWI